MTRLRLRGLAVLGATAVLVMLAFGSTDALAASTSVWSTAGQLALPTSASGSPTATSLPGISCTAVGACEAVGGFTATSGATQPMAFTETNAAWGQATAIGSPTGSTAAALNSVSCSAAGACEAAGSDVAGGASEAITATQTAGVWSQAVALPTLPSGTTSSTLDGISCVGAGNCAAVGSATSASGTQAMVSSSTSANGGAFGQATLITLPSTANNSGQDAVLDGVSCTTPGNCFAVGSFVDTSGSTQAMSVTQTGGVWGTAVELTLPTGAAPGGQHGVLRSISCTGSGGCSAVGSYVDNTGQTQAMTTTGSGSSFPAATELTLPAGAATSGQTAALDSVSCTSAGNCSATGSYFGTIAAPMTTTQISGSWGQATSLPEPAGAPQSPNPDSIALAVGCAAAERCSAAGTYPVSGGGGVMALSSHPSLAVAVGHLPNAAVAKAYSTTLAASGGTGGNVWSLIGGTLPAGLSFNAGGVISGTPTTDQTTTFAVAVTDSFGDRATATLTLTVGPSTGTTKPGGTTKTGTNKGSSKGKKKKVFRGAKVSHVKVLHHSEVRFKVKCIKRHSCAGRVSVVAYERLRGRRIIAIDATAPRHRTKGVRTRRLTLGTLRYSLKGGKSITRTIKLDRSARALLASRKKLHVSLTQRPSSAKSARTVRKKLTLHQPPPKKKHHGKKGAHKKGAATKAGHHKGGHHHKGTHGTS